MLAELVIWSISNKYEGSAKSMNLSLHVRVTRNMHGMFLSHEYTGVQVIYV